MGASGVEASPCRVVLVEVAAEDDVDEFFVLVFAFFVSEEWKVPSTNSSSGSKPDIFETYEVALLLLLLNSLDLENFFRLSPSSSMFWLLMLSGKDVGGKGGSKVIVGLAKFPIGA